MFLHLGVDETGNITLITAEHFAHFVFVGQITGQVLHDLAG
jgi:hypothetical protein